MGSCCQNAKQIYMTLYEIFIGQLFAREPEWSIPNAHVQGLILSQMGYNQGRHYLQLVLKDNILHLENTWAMIVSFVLYFPVNVG